MTQQLYGDDCLARSEVHKCFKRFQNGCKDLNDNERPGRPGSRVELVENYHETIAVKGSFTVRMLPEVSNLLLVLFGQF